MQHYYSCVNYMQMKFYVCQHSPTEETPERLFPDHDLVPVPMWDHPAQSIRQYSTCTCMYAVTRLWVHMGEKHTVSYLLTHLHIQHTLTIVWPSYYCSCADLRGESLYLYPQPHAAKCGQQQAPFSVATMLMMKLHNSYLPNCMQFWQETTLRVIRCIMNVYVPCRLGARIRTYARSSHHVRHALC